MERDLWLVQAVQELRPWVTRHGLTLPGRVAVSVATTQPTGGRPALGECWPSASTREGVPAIVISHALTSSTTVLSTIVHELLHAADDCKSQHGAWFVAWASALGLVGSPSTHAGPRLAKALGGMARRLGSYPASQYGYTMFDTGRLVA
jgi:hypothetical protein